MEEWEVQSLVIDHGNDTFKAGLAHKEKPQAYVPNLVMHETSEKLQSHYMGPAIEQHLTEDKYHKLEIVLEDGMVVNYDHLERIYHQIFYNELRLAPEEHPVFLTEIPRMPKAMKEKITQIMFETFNVPAFYIGSQPVLTLSALKLKTGLVIDSGEQMTCISAVHDGYLLPHASLQLKFGGKHIASYLKTLLIHREEDAWMAPTSSSTSSASSSASPAPISSTRSQSVPSISVPDFLVNRQLKKWKEKIGYVALNFEEEIEKVISSTSSPQYVEEEGKGKGKKF